MCRRDSRLYACRRHRSKFVGSGTALLTKSSSLLIRVLLSPSERVLDEGPLLLHSFLVKEFRHDLAELVCLAVGDAVVIWFV